MTKEFLSAFGAVVSAVVASLCCIGPFVAAILGVSAAGFAEWLRPYSRWLIGVTVALIGVGFYAVYGRTSARCQAEDASCRVAEGRQWQKPVLWLAAVVVLLLLLFPHYIPLLM